jgi:hypothetical protein
MNPHRSVEETLAPIAIRVAKASMLIPWLFIVLGRKIRSTWRALVSSKGRKRGPDDGSQGAGVTARLKPPPPVLSAAVANALPESGEEEAA